MWIEVRKVSAMKNTKTCRPEKSDFLSIVLELSGGMSKPIPKAGRTIIVPFCTVVRPL